MGGRRDEGMRFEGREMRGSGVSNDGRSIRGEIAVVDGRMAFHDGSTLVKGGKT